MNEPEKVAPAKWQWGHPSGQNRWVKKNGVWVKFVPVKKETFRETRKPKPDPG